ncbi:hypothetical protein [Gordonia rhizosphera]|uniref:Uncharacterized protein n=1 Tax=Gordonia rhizosphera NBRC 16068 TaxID=1108045 RepID=K6X189_9ACTN|nr:hypothetical protein [Gordonia rhizosphera]GAB92579.1 hypothetical protein GORHZ_184_00030 [Gordonia rhizosphera NBRC 16068]
MLTRRSVGYDSESDNAPTRLAAYLSDEPVAAGVDIGVSDQTFEAWLQAASVYDNVVPQLASAVCADDHLAGLLANDTQ